MAPEPADLLSLAPLLGFNSILLTTEKRGICFNVIAEPKDNTEFLINVPEKILLPLEHFQIK